MKRFWAIFKKELRQIKRDPLSLGVLVLIPALLLVMYGYALSFDVKHIPVAVLDEDRTQQSRQFLDSVFQNPYFDWKRTLSRRAEADDLLVRGQVRAVLIVPRTFSQDLQRGDQTRVQVLVDGADATSAARIETNQNGKPRHTVARITAGIAVGRSPSQSIISVVMPAAPNTRFSAPPIGA